jgi:hypothetical protein
MFKKAIIIAICLLMLIEIFAVFNDAEAQAQDRGKKKDPVWTKFWEWTKKHTFAFSITIVTIITIVSTIMTMVKKDKILNTLSGHLMTIELKGSQPDSDGSRYRGRLRVESEGLEVVEEKTNKSNEKVSYLIRKDEFTLIHALVRYHDLLTDREKEQRQHEVNRVYHPSIGQRLRRKIRNIVNEMKRVLVETFTILFGKIRERFGQYGKEMEAKGTELITYTTEATYDALIDRLIGTRVAVRVKDNLEYIGVLKDYSSSFIELLNVDYKNTWQTVLEKGNNFADHERGLVFERNGNDLIISSKGPFPVTLKHILWREDRPDADRKDINAKIEPFGQLKINLLPPKLDIKVSPFEKLQLPVQYSPTEYKKINLHFQSVRIADLVLLKNYGIIRHRAEKYEAKILDFGSLAEVLLTSRDEKLIMQGNPSSTTSLSIYNGYLTNLPKERMDFAAVDQQLGQRWTIENSFRTIDKKLRPSSKHYFLGLFPFIKARKIITLIALINIIQSDEKRKNDPILPWLYRALSRNNFVKKHKFYKKPVLIKKRKKRFGIIPKPIAYLGR